jgi:hypothetical protein
MLVRVMCVMLLLAFTAESPNDTVLYNALWRSPLESLGFLFVSIPGLSLTAWQLILFALVPFCLLRPAAFRRRDRTMDVAILVSMGSIAITFLWGFLRGGSAYNAYYQLWRFLLALLFGLLLLAVIRGPRDLKLLGRTVVLAAALRAVLAIYFYWFVVVDRVDPLPPYMTSHDDSLLFVAGLVVMLTYALERGGRWLWLGTFVVSMLLLYAIVLNNRRLAWLEVILALATAFALLPRGRIRRRVTRAALVASPVLALYVAIGWGRSGPLFEPLRALSTSGSDMDASSLARLEEIRNLMYTLSTVGNPVLGTGWGVPYQQVTTVYTHFGDAWWQYPYMPHNSLLGVVVFAGLVGIFGIWLVVPITAFMGTRGHRAATGAVDRAAAMSAIAILPAYGVQCYGDLGFWSVTPGLLLGVAMAVAGRVGSWPEPMPAREDPHRPVPRVRAARP